MATFEQEIASVARAYNNGERTKERALELVHFYIREFSRSRADANTILVNNFWPNAAELVEAGYEMGGKEISAFLDTCETIGAIIGYVGDYIHEELIPAIEDTGKHYLDLTIRELLALHDKTADKYESLGSREKEKEEVRTAIKNAEDSLKAAESSLKIVTELYKKDFLL